MSGHSKWSTIKRKKGAADEKRGKIFTTIIKEITVAIRMGGGDETSNSRLRQASVKAKDNNMPQDNIKRAIMKGTGELPGVNYEEGTYEGYGPGGVAIFLEVLTDNKKRTVADIRHLMSKHGGNLGENGSVAWMFDKRGQIIIHESAGKEDDVFESALDCGAEDFEVEEDTFLIFTDPSELMAVKDLGLSNGTSGAEYVRTLFNTEDRKINPRGGLIGAGHPLGATGISQIMEITMQLQNTTGKRQINDAKKGLVHNMSAAATSSTVLVLES